MHHTIGFSFLRVYTVQVSQKHIYSLQRIKTVINLLYYKPLVIFVTCFRPCSKKLNTGKIRALFIIEYGFIDITINIVIR